MDNNNNENENFGPNENLLQHDDRNNLDPDRRANNNAGSEDYEDESNPLYNPDKDFEEDSDMDDAFLDEDDEEE